MQKIITDIVQLEGEWEDLFLETDYSNLTINEGDELSVRYTLPEKMIPAIEMEGGILQVKSPHLGFKVLPVSFNETFSIAVTIPEKTKAGRFSIKLRAGNIDLANINADAMNVDVGAGNLTLKNCRIKDFKLRVKAGNVEVADCAFHHFATDVKAGNVKSYNTKIEKGICMTKMGNISLSGEIGMVSTRASLGNVEIKK
jgi:DUF4097 and DUF4098 domain-containing protein YvlB